MTPVKAVDLIQLGHDYRVFFGDKGLTLDKGFMVTGGALPDISTMVTPELEPVAFPAGVRKVIFTVPSLDTAVCEWQIKQLSETLTREGNKENARYYVVSVDTPFAQARFIREHNIHCDIQFISDYAEHQFMAHSGLRIIELNLFARAVILCDENNRVTDIRVSHDITQLP